MTIDPYSNPVDSFRGDFVVDYNNIVNKDVPDVGTTEPAQEIFYNYANQLGTQGFADGLWNLVFSGTKPTDLESFLQKLSTAIAQQGAAKNPPIAASVVKENAYIGFIASYEQMLGMGQLSFPSQASNALRDGGWSVPSSIIRDGGWSDLSGIITDAYGSQNSYVAGQKMLLFNQNFQQQFATEFTNFLKTADWSSRTAFFASWRNYSTQIATLSPVQYSKLPSFKGVYNTFFPQATEADYKAALADFYTVTIKKEGMFDPSKAFSDWVSTVQNNYAKNPISGTSFDANIATSSAVKVQVLDRIFELLLKLTQTMQKTTSVQSDRLFFLVQWQKAYTVAINRVPTFTADPVGGIPDKDARAEANTKMQTNMETLRGYRQAVADDAKAMQTSINQSNDAVTQHANLMTAILQQFSTILGSIFR